MRRFDWAWLVLLGVGSSAWCLTAARELSATFDEPFYMRAGLESWRSGSNHELMRAGTMPLPVDVQYLPIYIWEQIRGEPFDTKKDCHTILPFARAMNLVFWWLLLIYGTLLARQVGGPWAGRFATLLIATEPNLLGHACLATTDISVTALILACVYHFQTGRERGWVLRWLVPGILFGLALSAKVSSLTFVPLIFGAFEIVRVYRDGLLPPLSETERGEQGRYKLTRLWYATWPAQRDAWRVFFVGIAFVFAYCGSDWKPQHKWVSNVDQLSEDGRFTPALRWTTHNLAVFPNASEAFFYQFKHNVKGHDVVVMGEWHHRAVWYYFPITLSIKLTLPVLLLLAGLTIVRPRAWLTPLGLAGLLLLLFSLNCRVQIGIRLVFPLLVMLLLALATGIGKAVSEWGERTKCGLLAVTFFACTYPAAGVWPDGLRFGNELWGGTENTYQHLTDSSYDWGQGVRDLERWTKDRDLPPAWVWYYGSDPAIAFDRDRTVPLHMPNLYDIRSPDDVWRFVKGKLVAVSASILYGNPYLTPTMIHGVEFFRGQTPIGRSRTFFVFDFRERSL